MSYAGEKMVKNLQQFPERRFFRVQAAKYGGEKLQDAGDKKGISRLFPKGLPAPVRRGRESFGSKKRAFCKKGFTTPARVNIIYEKSACGEVCC